MRQPAPPPRPLAPFLVAGALLLGGGLLSHWQDQRPSQADPVPAVSGGSAAPSLRSLPPQTPLDSSTQAALLAQLSAADQE